MAKSQITYSEIKKNEISEAYSLVRKVYDEFVSNENSDQGNDVFYDFIKYDNAKKRLSEICFSIIAKINGKICGIIEIKNYNHVCLLFVEKEMHEQGIAKTMLKLAADKCIRNNSDFIDVNSSLYAVPIYEKLGFRTTEGKKLINGINFVPMLFKIKKTG